MSRAENQSVVLPQENQQSSDMILTVPNMLSFLRILLILPFVLMFFLNHIIAAFICLVLSGISDMLDGFLARLLHQTSELGKLLDPIADKLTLLAVVICLGIRIPEIFPLMIILIVKDIFMIGGGVYLVRNGITPPQSRWYGKVATIMFYLCVVSVVLYRELLEYDMKKLTVILFVLTVGMMVFALLNYTRLFFRLINEKKHKGS